MHLLERAESTDYRLNEWFICWVPMHWKCPWMYLQQSQIVRKMPSSYNKVYMENNYIYDLK